MVSVQVTQKDPGFDCENETAYDKRAPCDVQIGANMFTCECDFRIVFAGVVRCWQLTSKNRNFTLNMIKRPEGIM